MPILPHSLKEALLRWLSVYWGYFVAFSVAFIIAGYFRRTQIITVKCSATLLDGSWMCVVEMPADILHIHRSRRLSVRNNTRTENQAQQSERRLLQQNPFSNHLALNPAYNLIYSLGTKDEFKGKFRFFDDKGV